MPVVRQVIQGFSIALISGGIILGGFSLSFAEGQIAVSAPASPTIPPPTWAPFTPMSGAIHTPILVTPTWTATIQPTPSNCPPPPSWSPYLVRQGDTLELLASRFNITVNEIMINNCLLTTEILPGSLLYLPPVPTATVKPCGPPYGWVTYIVQPGDTLYKLAQAFGNGITVEDLQQANCLGTSDTIRHGYPIYVPPWGTITPMPTLIMPVTDTPSGTPTEPVPFDTPTDTPTYTPTPSDTPEPPTFTP